MEKALNRTIQTGSMSYVEVWDKIASDIVGIVMC